MNWLHYKKRKRKSNHLSLTANESFFGIGNINQEQRITGHRSSSPAPVFLLNDTAETFDSEFTPAYLKQRTYHRTHHIPQETVCLNGKHPSHFIHLCPSCMHYFTIVSLDISMQLTETGEVRIFKQSLCSLIHPFKIGSLKQAATILTIERHLSGSDIIFIHACRSIKTRMSIGTHSPQTVNGNVRRKQAIQLVRHEIHIQRSITIKMSHH